MGAASTLGGVERKDNGATIPDLANSAPEAAWLPSK